MFIGEVAKRTGLTLKAIRLYEEAGLIRPTRSDANYRLYREADVGLLKLIIEARQMGMRVSQIKTAIRYDQGEIDWAHVNAYLTDYRQTLLQEVERLKSNLNQLDACIEELNSPEPAGHAACFRA
ncbi:MerR family transcriptional regulator [Marinobacterium iners]|uniref:DNA-binding transcriptional regulator, MerR family n=1 Tax=Marinobacterium iners DSM 11526 TaxID=1122198 RepID=A0A1H4FNR2_9GAMM|nr:MerR family transcriptional regulator [Marinobacterium iners]SEA98791.1 DNA-binding transcriptional regulator, MerR family [Marinobacterium iners DSM 11526]